MSGLQNAEMRIFVLLDHGKDLVRAVDAETQKPDGAKSVCQCRRRSKKGDTVAVDLHKDCPRWNTRSTTRTSWSRPAGASACSERNQLIDRHGRTTVRREGGRRRHVAGQLHDPRSRINRLGAENHSDYRQPVRHEGVTHVSRSDKKSAGGGASLERTRLQ